jgi:hypothetical protein
MNYTTQFWLHACNTPKKNNNNNQVKTYFVTYPKQKKKKKKKKKSFCGFIDSQVGTVSNGSKHSLTTINDK